MKRSNLWIGSALQLGLAILLYSIVCGGNLLAAESVQRNSERLIVHEWGTFTTLQDDAGKQLGGINIDDEPLPPFVHDLHPHVLGAQHATWSGYQQKGAPPRHPYVTLRLETPVIYFYPPKSQALPMTLNVDVKFLGGWLTQFFPDAQADAPGLQKGNFKFGPINRDTVGRLSWTNLKVGTTSDGPQTDEAVWVTPRNVQSASVTTGQGETEKYLFYRGVGNILSPISVSTDRKQNTLSLRANFDEVLKSGESAAIAELWLVHIQPNGTTAFKKLNRVEVSGDKRSSVVAENIQANFAKADYSAENLDTLQRSMHAALVQDGLFDEEATAMLQTWQKSYFASGGLRLFYMVPRLWTDHYLPLSVSKDCDLKRTMIARTELISSEQLALLEQLATAKLTDPKWINELKNSPSVKKFRSGRSGFGDLGVPIPADFQIYLDLGRFRNALLLHDQVTRNSRTLALFIDYYNLDSFKPPVD